MVSTDMPAKCESLVKALLATPRGVEGLAVRAAKENHETERVHSALAIRECRRAFTSASATFSAFNFVWTHQ